MADNTLIPYTKQFAYGLRTSASGPAADRAETDGPPDNFGVQSLESISSGRKAPKHPKGTLRDHERGARPPIGGNQANANHGPQDD